MAAIAQQVGRSFRHRFEGPWFRRVFLAGVRAIPPELQRASMPVWAGLFYALLPSARRIVEGNLARVLGDASAAEVRRRGFRVFVNYAQSLTDMYGFHLGRRVPIAPEFRGRDHVHRVVDGGRGAITVTGHVGAWQITPFLIAQAGGLPPVTMAMAEEPNAAVAEFESRFRARLRIVYTTGSPFSLIELSNRLRRGELVGMQVDRHLGGPSLQLPFFGRAAPFPLGPATLARLTGCPIIPVFSHYAAPRRRGVIVEYGTPIEVERTADRDADVRRATLEVVDAYEQFVRRHPDQWFNFYDFWDPPAARPA
jgi:KDO2-lipid IV(A) lauroyltransferase